MGRSCSQNGRGRSFFKILTGKRPLGRPRRRRDFKEIGIKRGIRLIRLRIGIIGEPCELCIGPPDSISHVAYHVTLYIVSNSPFY